MKEFIIPIDSIKNGIQRYDRNRANTGDLVSCVNLRLSEFGVENREPMLTPINTNNYPNDVFPYPFLYFGKQHSIFISTDGIFYFTATFALVSLPVYDMDSTIVTGQLPDLFHHPHIIDHGETWTILIGDTMYYHDAEAVQCGMSDRVTRLTGLTAKAGADFNGRTILGGFDKSLGQQFGPVWSQYMDTIRTDRDLDGTFDNSLEDNMILWGAVGTELIPSLFYPDTGFGDDNVNPNMLDLFRQGDAGFMPMTFKSNVLAIKHLGDMVIVYGDDGITALRPASVEGQHTFSRKHVANIGIVDNSAVGVAEDRHIFISQAGTVWEIDQSLQLRELGYRHIFADVSTFVISYIRRNDAFYIATSDIRTFIINKFGMTQDTRHITALNEEPEGFALISFITKDTPDENITNISFETSRMDMNAGAMKSIEYVYIEYIGDNNLDISVRVGDKYHRAVGFSYTNPVILNNEGYAYTKAAGVEFTIEITSTDKTITPARLEVGYKADDKRYRRGVHGNPINSTGR